MMRWGGTRREVKEKKQDRLNEKQKGGPGTSGPKEIGKKKKRRTGEKELRLLKSNYLRYTACEGPRLEANRKSNNRILPAGWRFRRLGERRLEEGNAGGVRTIAGSGGF